MSKSRLLLGLVFMTTLACSSSSVTGPDAGGSATDAGDSGALPMDSGVDSAVVPVDSGVDSASEDAGYGCPFGCIEQNRLGGCIAQYPVFCGCYYDGGGFPPGPTPGNCQAGS